MRAGDSEKSVVIVGNGASLLGLHLGETIESADVIVRFNRFVTATFDRDVGSRTSVWFVNRDVHHTTLQRTLRAVECEEIVVHTWADEREAADSFRHALVELGRATVVS